MYHTIVERKARASFARLNEGDYEAVLEDFAPDVRYRFAGSGPLGGSTHSVEGARARFQRLFAIFPTLRFDLKTVLVRGWPWDTTVAVEWVDSAVPSDGQPYVNEGVNVIRLRWGRVVEVRVYLDTERLSQTCDRLAAHGVSAAAAGRLDE